MDRSFLSHAGVIAESRKFVCVRLQTYENRDERDLLKSIFIGRSGDLENTTFSIMDPSGTEDLVRPGRSPKRTFSDPAAMADRMRIIAEKLKAKAPVSVPALPYLESLRLALNVAACDNLPLIVTLADSAKELESMEQKLLPLAWSRSLQGNFLYVSAKREELKDKVEGLRPDSDIVILDPETFGRFGKVLSQLPSDVGTSKLLDELRRAGEQHIPDVKERFDHVRDGGRKGIRWESELEVTDPGGRGARGRGDDRRRGDRRSSDRRSGDRRSGSSPSEDPGSSRRGEQGGETSPSRESSRLLHPLLRAIDANGDGELSREEIAVSARAIEKLDKNGDGKISSDELRPRRRRSD